METSNMEMLKVSGMTCGSCEGRVYDAVMAVEGISQAIVSHSENSVYFTGEEFANIDNVIEAISKAGYTVEGFEQSFDWTDKSVWGKSAYNTMWCLIGCSIGDLGTIAYFQFVWTDSGWSTMAIMMLAIMNGLLTSIALETFILLKQLPFMNALKTAMGMSFISMVSMEAAMNITDILITGGAMLTWKAIIPMWVAGFVTPWPYNYWRLKKYGKACH